ncbi:ead/Ea22-like family protein [Salmonella enterica]|nr:ead/Ea22-like family protein [Salmonella enterica]EJB6674157.1 ead/Ea22-like family protein [Salmonella enterica]EJO0848237.1 ead/Ea22-like family protein [Salmonella enterica]EKJ5586909.1 ead/Ea22-like family protein [Salmonella enterica]
MTINKQALREVAEKATPGTWCRSSSQFNGITATPFSLCGEEVMLAHTVEKRDAEFIAAAKPATILALLDELEAAESQNGYLREQRDEWERKAISNFEECTEMSARIEELESQRKLAFTASNRWADKFREAEKRIAEHNFENRLLANADRDIKTLRQRIAELEERSVSIPEVRIIVAESKQKNLTWRELGAYNEGADVAKETIIAALRAAGIGVKGE